VELPVLAARSALRLARRQQALDFFKQIENFERFVQTACRANVVGPVLGVGAPAHHQDRQPSVAFAELAYEIPAV